MALSKLDKLYKQVILDHSSQPRRFNRAIEATHTLELVNTTCGDVIRIFVQVDKDTIIDAAFSGHGCSISQASASMMMTQIVGKTIDEAQYLASQFFEVVQGKESTVDLGDAQLLEGVSQFPARIKCATLAWKSLYQLIEFEIKERDTV